MDHSVMSAPRHSARMAVAIWLALFRGHTLRYARYGTYAAARLDTPPKVEVLIVSTAKAHDNQAEPWRGFCLWS